MDTQIETKPIQRVTNIFPKEAPLESVHFSLGDNGCRGWATATKAGDAFAVCVNTVGPNDEVYYSEAMYSAEQLTELAHSLLRLAGHAN